MATATKRDIPYADCESIGLSITGKDAQQIIDPLNAYLKAFAAPIEGNEVVLTTSGGSC